LYFPSKIALLYILAHKIYKFISNAVFTLWG